MIAHLHHCKTSQGAVTAPRYGRYWLEARPAAPSRSAIETRFGGWNQALMAAGLPLSDRPGRLPGRWTPDACARAVLEVWDHLGKPPTVREYDAYKRDHPDRVPCNALIRRKFRGWPEALDAADEVRP